METKTQIRDEIAEKVVLGTIIAERGAIDKVRELLSEECFYDNFHAEIYKAIIQITSEGDRADIISVRSKLLANDVKVDMSEIGRASCRERV